ncbi:MAG: TspO/MBR family protein [Candidatus Latescibacterota bacterium]
MSRLKEGIQLLISIALPQAAGGIGSLFTKAGMEIWYRKLDKPPFSPPSWVFAPVWITLYILMGLSAFLVWRRGWHRREVKSALGVYAAQLIRNTLGSFVLVGRHSIGGGLAIIIALWILILATMVKFFQISRWAGILLIPYLLWVTFAAVLNYSFYMLNK